MVATNFGLVDSFGTRPHAKRTHRDAQRRGCSRRHAFAPAALASILMAFVVLLAGSLSAQASVPGVVASSQITFGTGLNAGKIVLDSCGNVYESEVDGTVKEVPVDGSGAVTVFPSVGYGSTALAIDSSDNLYFDQRYSSYLNKVPIVGCVPQPSQATKVANNFGSIAIYYYDASDVAVDAAGNLFISTFCCSNEILEVTASGGYSIVLASYSAQITSLAVDASDNLYFTDGSSSVWELPVGTKTPVAIGSGFSAPTGVSIDKQGNLYVSDGNKSAVYKIPFETTGSTSALNPADQYIVLQNVPAQHPVGIDSAQNIYLAPGYYSSGEIFKEAIGTAPFPATAIGQSSSSLPINFAFNATVTPAAIDVLTGGTASIFFALTPGSCTAGTTYSAGQGCSLSVAYTSSAAGHQRGAVVLSDANGLPLGNVNLDGLGQGAGLVIDPASVSTLGSGLKAPQGIAVDDLGNVYIADAAGNKVTKLPAGGGTAVTVGTGLSAPSGVAVDGAGNVFIADKGNNRILEVPVVKGVLSSAAQFPVGSGLKGPASVAITPSGSLLVADTGNGRALLITNGGGSLSSGQTIVLGSGYSKPLAVNADGAGNIVIADSGNGDIYELSAPLGSKGIVKIAGGFNQPSALAFDAAAALYLVDQGDDKVLRVPLSGGQLSFNDETQVGSAVAAPYGVAADFTGNLYVTDSTNAAAYMLNRTQAAIQFDRWNVGTTSGTLTSIVSSSGNLPLTLASPAYTVAGNSTDFAFQSAGSAACTGGGTLAASESCQIPATFSPTVTGVRTLTLTFAGSNAANAAAPQLALTGTGVQLINSTLTLALTSPATGSPSFGEAITIGATLAVSGTTLTPTGNITFLVNGLQQGVVPVTGNTASLSIPNGLNGGTYSITAFYSGDDNFARSSATPLSFTVTQLPTATTLSLVAPFNNPDNALTSSQVPLTAVVAVGQTKGTPTGTVQFLQGTTILGTAPLLPAPGGLYAATYTTTANQLSAGTTLGENGIALQVSTITATYSGDINFLGSKASVPLTVEAGPTFAVETTSTTISASKTSPGTYTVNLRSYGGWRGVVNFTCIGLPTYATCQTLPGSPVINASTASSTVTPSSVLLTVTVDVPPVKPTAGSMAWYVSALFGLSFLMMRRRLGKRFQGVFYTVLGILLLAGASLGITACSSSPKFATPTGSDSFTLQIQGAQFQVTNPPQAILTGTPDAPVSLPLTLTVQ